MSDPIVFISHLRIKEGKLEDYKRFTRENVPVLQAGKPRTIVFLAYLDEDEERTTIVHAFGDAEAMDLHLQGADERVSSVTDLIEPDGYEIYGTPSDTALSTMRRFAESGGVGLVVHPEYVDGYLRLATG